MIRTSHKSIRVDHRLSISVIQRQKKSNFNRIDSGSSRKKNCNKPASCCKPSIFCSNEPWTMREVYHLSNTPDKSLRNPILPLSFRSIDKHRIETGGWSYTVLSDVFLLAILNRTYPLRKTEKLLSNYFVLFYAKTFKNNSIFRHRQTENANISHAIFVLFWIFPKFSTLTFLIGISLEFLLSPLVLLTDHIKNSVACVSCVCTRVTGKWCNRKRNVIKVLSFGAISMKYQPYSCRRVTIGL